ncbi:MAG: hypothetical protein KJ043_21165, partial [Anaerolineae bacterium]|nr:hypothetical protein [Anaerolineae bacterium]
MVKHDNSPLALFRQRLFGYCKQAQYKGTWLTGTALANLLTYKLKRRFKQQDISDWYNKKIIDPNTFRAVLELLTFHDAFSSYEDAKGLLSLYQQAAQQTHATADTIVFKKTDFAHWRTIKRTIFEHLPSHITSLIENVVEMDDMIEQVSTGLLNLVYANSFEGQGGIGKTSAAVKVAQILGGTGVYEGVYFVGVRQGFLDEEGEHNWVDEPIHHLDGALSELASQMGIALAQNLPKDEKLALIADYYQQHQVVVILDNLETYEDVQEFSNFIKKLTRLDTHSRLIITSRRNLDNISARIQQIQPRELTSEYAHIMLQKYGCQVTLDEVTRLHAEIGGNPLALWLFSVLIKNFSVDELLAKFTQVKSEWDTNDDAFKRHSNLFDYLYERILELLGENARELCWDLGMNFMMERGVSL